MAAGASHISEPNSTLAVARLLRPQGRLGELLTEPLTDLLDVFETGQTFDLHPVDKWQSTQIKLSGMWRPQGRNAGRLVLKLAGVDSITEAEALSGAELHLPLSALPALEADTFLVSDLLGCTLLDGDAPLGTVVDVQFPIGADGRTRLADAADLLAIEPLNAAPGTEPLLVPFVKAWLEAVDLPQRTIRMRLPAGLFTP